MSELSPQAEARDVKLALNGAPIEAQRCGFDGERRGSGMSELSPQAEARDMKLAPTCFT